MLIAEEVGGYNSEGKEEDASFYRPFSFFRYDLLCHPVVSTPTVRENEKHLQMYRFWI